MCLPKKFVWTFSLSLGALVCGIVSLCILILCAIILGVQLFRAKDCDPSPSCKQMVLRTCLSHEITGFVYLVLMILANIWFFHGLRKKKVSVLLTWIGVYALWIFLLLVDMITYSIHYITQENKHTGAIVGLVIGLIVFAILIYGLLVTIAFWKELKSAKKEIPLPTSTA